MSVTGAAHQPTARFAATDHGPTPPSMSASKGNTAACAAMHTASGWATTVGTTRSSRVASAGAHNAIAATAAADIAKPGSHASRGSSTATAMTPELSAGSAWAGLPHHSAAQMTPAMVAARITDGSGNTTHTSSPMAAPVAHATTLRDLTSSLSSAVTATSTIAKCDPDTAVRCVRPASDICAR